MYLTTFNLLYLLVKNPEKAQLIQPPMMIMGKTLVTLPFNISVIMLGSVIDEPRHEKTCLQDF